MGDRGDVCDARAFSDLLRCPKSPSQCLIVRCRPSDGRASPSVVEVSGNRKRPMPAVQYIHVRCNAIVRSVRTVLQLHARGDA